MFWVPKANLKEHRKVYIVRNPYYLYGFLVKAMLRLLVKY